MHIQDLAVWIISGGDVDHDIAVLNIVQQIEDRQECLAPQKE